MCKQIIAYCKAGGPEKCSLNGPVKLYVLFVAELTVQNGLLFKGSRLVTPASMRLDRLDKLHTGHQGMVKCLVRARECLVAWDRSTIRRACKRVFRLQKVQTKPCRAFDRIGASRLPFAKSSLWPTLLERKDIPNSGKLLLSLHWSVSVSKEYITKHRRKSENCTQSFRGSWNVSLWQWS